MKTSRLKTVCVVGLWHLGLVNAVGFAEKDYRVIGLDFKPEIVAAIKKGNLPLYEPLLKELLKKHLKSGRLTFFSEPKYITQADYVLIAYDSPLDKNNAVNIRPILKAGERIAPYLSQGTPVIITSQMPLGTSERMQNLLRRHNGHWLSGVIYVPENLRLGQAVKTFLNPKMLVFGADNVQIRQKAYQLYKTFETKKFAVDLATAEMVKHALNTFLATAITFGNEIAHLCERLDADAVAVASILKTDERVGQAPIFPGLGFSGGTLARDVLQLAKFSQKLRYPAHLLKAIIRINEITFEQVLDKLVRKMKTLKNKTIGFLGLTYKPGTSTLRHSPIFKLMPQLTAAGAFCLAYDPKVNLNEVKLKFSNLQMVKSTKELACRSDILVLISEWPEFQKIDFVGLAQLMKRPIIIDAKNYLDAHLLKKSGFEYEGYGRGNLKP